MDAGVLVQVLVAGLSAGAVLGLVALGFTLVAGTVRILHLAHGDVVVAAVFAGVLGVLGRTPVSTALGTASSAAFTLLVLAAGALLAGLIAVVAIRPYLPRVGRRSDPLGWVAAGVASGLLLRAVFGLVLPQQGYAVPDPLRLSALSADGLVHLPGGTTVPVRALGVVVVARCRRRP